MVILSTTRTHRGRCPRALLSLWRQRRGRRSETQLPRDKSAAQNLPFPPAPSTEVSLQGGRLPPLYHGVTWPLFLFITSFSPFANHLSPPSSYFRFSFSTVHRRPRSPAFLMSSSHCFHFSRSDRTFAFNRLIQIQIPNPKKKKRH